MWYIDRVVPIAEESLPSPGLGSGTTAKTPLAWMPGEEFCAVDDGTRRWSVLHVKPRQEKSVASVLMEVGIPYYLPLVNKTRYYGHRKRVVNTPLFPSYVFVRGTVEETYFAISTHRVAKVIPVGDQNELERDIERIRSVLQLGGELEPYPYLKVGTPVRVTGGPFQGVEGLIEEHRSWNRLILVVHTLGRAASLEIDASLLERVD